jgi:hypothetical protein
MWAGVVSAEERLHLAQNQLADAEAGPGDHVKVAELRKRVAGATLELTRAQHRWDRHASGRPGGGERQGADSLFAE